MVYSRHFYQKLHLGYIVKCSCIIGTYNFLTGKREKEKKKGKKHTSKARVILTTHCLNELHPQIMDAIKFNKSFYFGKTYTRNVGMILRITDHWGDEGWVGKTGEGGQKAQTSSYKINKQKNNKIK